MEINSPRVPTSRAAKRSIAGKLALLVAIAVGASALTMSGVMLWQEISRYAELRARSLFASAHVFAAAAAQGVAAGDQNAIYQAIRAIDRVPGLTYARVESHGRIIAALGGATSLDDDLRVAKSNLESLISPYSVLASRSIQVDVPIINGGVDVGRLVLVADASDLLEELVRSVRGMALGAQLPLQSV